MVRRIYQLLVVLLLSKHRHALLVTPSARVPSKIRYNNALLSTYNQNHIITKHQHHQLRRRHRALYSSTAVASDNSDESIDAVPLSVAMGVGVITSFIGYAYSKCMKTGFHLLWSTLPSKLLGDGGFKLLKQHPAAYIFLMMTLGGALVATLSTLYFPNMFSAHDFVHILSKEDGADMNEFPSARKHLLPVMICCCLTSISGFSLGPEGPMVAAGGLAGVALARKFVSTPDKKASASVEETLAYAGAAGTLTGFMNIPLAGPIFAMEMTSRHMGISANAAKKSWGAAIAASLAGFVFVRGGLEPNLNIGGHFTYGAKAAVGAITGKEMVLASLVCGIGGAVVGTCFHKTVAFLKSVLWPSSNKSQSTNKEKYVTIAKKTLVALVIGIISMYYPQTMFWGEGSLQCVVDGQCTPFSATPHGIPHIMMQFAKVDPNLPYASGMAALQIGIAKFLAIALASAGKFPGGVIFPLLSNGASFAHGLVSALHPLIPAASSSLVSPLMVMSLMAATLTSITRTPLATVLILALSASGMTQLSLLLPGVLMASYVSVWVSNRLSSDSFFSYTK